MFISNVLKFFGGALSVGALTFTPIYLTGKFSGSTDNSFNNLVSASQDAHQPSRTDSPQSEQDLKEKKYDDCLDNSITFKVKSKSDGREIGIVKSGEVKNYLDTSKYDIETLYAGQCNKDKLFSTSLQLSR